MLLAAAQYMSLGHRAFGVVAVREMAQRDLTSLAVALQWQGSRWRGVAWRGVVWLAVKCPWQKDQLRPKLILVESSCAFGML
jgi:hypothetical protein